MEECTKASEREAASTGLVAWERGLFLCRRRSVSKNQGPKGSTSRIEEELDLVAAVAERGEWLAVARLLVFCFCLLKGNLKGIMVALYMQLKIGKKEERDEGCGEEGKGCGEDDLGMTGFKGRYHQFRAATHP